MAAPTLGPDRHFKHVCTQDAARYALYPTKLNVMGTTRVVFLSKRDTLEARRGLGIQCFKGLSCC